MKLIGWLGLNMKLIGWLGLNMKLIGWIGLNMKLNGWLRLNMKLNGWLRLNMKLIGWLRLNMKLNGWLRLNMKLTGWTEMFLVCSMPPTYSNIVLSLSNTCSGYNMSKYASNFKIPYYHPLNQWLLGATNGNQGQIMMHI